MFIDEKEEEFLKTTYKMRKYMKSNSSLDVKRMNLSEGDMSEEV